MKYFIVVVLISISLYYVKCQWDECRDAGLSKVYCIQHIN